LPRSSFVFSLPLFALSLRASKIASVVRSIVALRAAQIPPNLSIAVCITDVRVSSDLSYADISISAISGVEKAIKHLQSAKGEMRALIAAQLQAHRVPILRFHSDIEGQKASRLDTLLDSLGK
jgi:ribosome-binding factor A